MKKCICGNNLFFIREKQSSNQILHVGAYCSTCNQWLRWLPAERPEEDLSHIGEIEIPFGKYKGTKLKDLKKEYLQWMSEKMSEPWAGRAVNILHTPHSCLNSSKDVV